MEMMRERHRYIKIQLCEKDTGIWKSIRKSYMVYWMVTFSMTLNGPWRSYELQYESNGFSHFPNTFIKLFEKHFPFVRLSKKRMKNKQWITKGLKKSSKQKNKLYKKWLSTKNREDEINYKEYRKRVNSTSIFMSRQLSDCDDLILSVFQNFTVRSLIWT